MKNQTFCLMIECIVILYLTIVGNLTFAMYFNLAEMYFIPSFIFSFFAFAIAKHVTINGIEWMEDVQ